MEENTKRLARSSAARWYARLQASDCTPSEHAEFEIWLHSSPDNLQAYQKAEALVSAVSAAAKSDSRFVDLGSAAKARPNDSSLSGWRVAAVLMIGVGIAITGLASLNPIGATVQVTEHNNASKQQQRYVLEDGSVAFLDVGSRMSIRMSKAKREVTLLAGRAYFEVVHNEYRPFLVNAGAVRTTDLGTRFQVSLSAADVSVTLVEGAVEVSDQSDKGQWQQTLRPGEQVMLATGSTTLEKRDVDAAALTSWSTGRLMFKGTPLASALDEVNRYSDCKIHLGDASLASIPIGGNFIAGGDSAQVIDALAAVLPLRVVHVGTNEILLFRRNDT